MPKSLSIHSTIPRAALYIRVSTEEQAMHGYSLQAQEDNLILYAQEHGYKIAGIYRDEGNSARKPITKRKVVLQLLEDVKQDKLDLILFIKLDRWTRNVEAYHTVQRVLDAHNVSWQTMRAANPTLPTTRLAPGTRYCVPPQQSRRLCPSGSYSYVMSDGENLATLSQDFGLAPGLFLTVNTQLAPSDFTGGRVICVP